MAVILVLQNNELVAMLLYQTNPVRVQLFSYVNTFFCSNKFARLLAAWVKPLHLILSTGIPIPLMIFLAVPSPQQSTQGGGTSRYRLLEKLGPYCHHCYPWLYLDQNLWPSPPHLVHLCPLGECYLYSKHRNTFNKVSVIWPLCACTQRTRRT